MTATPAQTPTPYQSLVTPQAAPAQTDGREALTLEFELPADETARAQALVKEGKNAEAVRTYLLALQKNPQDSRAWWELGMLYYRSGQKDYAIRCFDAVVKLRPTDLKFAEWLARYKAQP
jgi:Flp pilus assembly protein TadD